MKDLLTSIEFWIAMSFASVIKIKASPRLTLIGSLITIAAAVSSALIFTLPLLDFFELTGDMYVAAVAALVALSAEHIARQVLDLKIVELIKAWRGN